MATPSMSAAPPALVLSLATAVSACKIHRPRFSDDNYLDLPRILKLGFDSPGDFFRQRRHPHVVDVVRLHEDANLAPCLNREDLLHAAIARRDTFETLEPLHVRFERLAARSRARSGNRVRSLH